MRDRWTVVLGAALAAIVAFPSVAGAHADYERSEPPSGATLRQVPARVDVWFTQEMFRREGANTLSVEGPDGSTVDSGGVTLDDADRTHLSIGLLPQLPAGEYVVRWTTLSAVDGDTAEGSFTFTVDPDAAAASPSASEPATPSSGDVASDDSGASGAAPESRLIDEDGGFPWWALVAATAIAAATVLGGWALLAGRGEERSTP